MNKFRVLRPDEIDCRIAQISTDRNGEVTGLSLLLYKDARCDQNILDETVGPMNWQRHHIRENANCIVSIWDDEKKQWIEKEDTGTESNTEKEKGLASDSFKRACFNWGIGRELYTAPFIWIKPADFNISERNGRKTCYDRFTVKGIGYTDGVITGLEIKNEKTGKLCYKFGKIETTAPEKPEKPDTEPGLRNGEIITQKVQEANIEPKKAAEKAVITTADKVPELVTISDDDNSVRSYLARAIAGMREVRGITAAENKKIFNEQHKKLIAAQMVPDKKLEEYTMEEAIKLIDLMAKSNRRAG